MATKLRFPIYGSNKRKLLLETFKEPERIVVRRPTDEEIIRHRISIMTKVTSGVEPGIHHHINYKRKLITNSGNEKK